MEQRRIRTEPYLMQWFETNDRVQLAYFDSEAPVVAEDDTGEGESAGKDGDGEGKQKEVLILLHGFTGSSLYWQHLIPHFTSSYRIIAPDLRNHGISSHQPHGSHVSRLAMDLRELLDHLHLIPYVNYPTVKISAIGSSLGAAILWCYAELFTTSPFQSMVFVDQSPLQNLSTLNGDTWDLRFCNRGMNNPSAVATLQETLAKEPQEAHKGTIGACLAYRSHPRAGDPVKGSERWERDEEFFLEQAMRGNQEWFGKLMADHTALDWRSSIERMFGKGSGSQTKVLVVASSRSGCFPEEGVLRVVDLINGEAQEERAKGVAVDWGGHWCFWEDPERFNQLVGGWLGVSK